LPPGGEKGWAFASHGALSIPVGHCISRPQIFTLDRIELLHVLALGFHTHRRAGTVIKTALQAGMLLQSPRPTPRLPTGQSTQGGLPRSAHAPEEAARERPAFPTTDFSLAPRDRLWQQPANLLVSPCSPYAALLMLSSGAGGEMATALARVLRMQTTGKDLGAFWPAKRGVAATRMAMPVLGLGEDPLTPFQVEHPFPVIIRDQPSGTPSGRP
jgi:hypothetical protein